MSLCHGALNTVDFVAGGSAAGTQCSACVPPQYWSVVIGCCAAGSDVRNCHLAYLSGRKF